MNADMTTSVLSLADRLAPATEMTPMQETGVATTHPVSSSSSNRPKRIVALAALIIIASTIAYIIDRLSNVILELSNNDQFITRMATSIGDYLLLKYNMTCPSTSASSSNSQLPINMRDRSDFPHDLGLDAETG